MDKQAKSLAAALRPFTRLTIEGGYMEGLTPAQMSKAVKKARLALAGLAGDGGSIG